MNGATSEIPIPEAIDKGTAHRVDFKRIGRDARLRIIPYRRGSSTLA
jgi:hypothetical protein